MSFSLCWSSLGRIRVKLIQSHLSVFFSFFLLPLFPPLSLVFFYIVLSLKLKDYHELPSAHHSDWWGLFLEAALWKLTPLPLCWSLCVRVNHCCITHLCLCVISLCISVCQIKTSYEFYQQITGVYACWNKIIIASKLNHSGFVLVLWVIRTLILDCFACVLAIFATVCLMSKGLWISLRLRERM